MRTTTPSAGGLWLLSLGCAVLAGCATGTSGPAPIVDRNASRAPATAPVASVPAEPGYHLVQRGDTLYSIARQYGQDPKNIIIWNQIENPNAIAPGQRVRVAAPGAASTAATSGTGVEIKPVSPQGGIDARPLVVAPLPDSGASSGAAPAAPGVEPKPAAASADSIKREPRGGKQPYSEQAWARVQAGDDRPAGAVVAPTVSPNSGEAKPAARPDASSSNGAAEPKSEAKPADNTLDWSWPTGGKLVAGFSDANSKGIDIGGKLGDPVLAAATGKVLYAGQDLRGYGKLVVVKHTNQYLSVYAHNSEILVKEGQTVNKGQKIAELGKSDAQEPKLHFEIRRQGKPVDPLQYLPTR